MLLDGKRPEMVEIRERPLAILGDVDVYGVEPRPCLALHQVVERRPPQPRNERRHEKDERKYAVIERENAQHAPHVKIAEIVRFIAGVVENASDQKSGEDEEKLNPVGAVVGHADYDVFNPVRRRHGADEVEQHDHQDREASHAVQRRQMRTSAQALDRAGLGRGAHGGKRDCVSGPVDPADLRAEGHDDNPTYR